MARHLTHTITRLLVVASLGTGSTQAGVMIGPRQVADALSARDVHVAAAQIELPAPVPARHSGARLELVSIETLDAVHSKLKLRCSSPADCLPFYAVVAWKDDEDPASLRYQLSLPRHPEGVRASAQGPPLVRVGDTATLVLEGRNVSIRLPVICLSSGSVGGSIRVTTTDRKHVYRAQVAGPGLLKGGL